MSERRGLLARLGLTLLAFLFPGSAHVRLGRYRRATALFGGLLALTFAINIYVWLIRDWTFNKWLVALTATIVLILLMVVSAVLTWLDSRLRERPVPLGSRWFVVALLPIASIIMNVTPPEVRDSIQPFWIPAESMRPTLEVADYILVQRRHLDPVRAGDVIVFNHAGSARVNRVVAVGGQTVEVRAGRVFVDRVPARMGLRYADGVVREQLRGSTASHLIRDEGYSAGDDFLSARVPNGHVFLLGDNRDMSADSRFGASEYGVGMVSTRSIVGRAKFMWWSRTRNRIGLIL